MKGNAWMAYSNDLNNRTIKATSRWKNIDSNEMFGGICYFLNGSIICGIQADSLILRLGTIAAELALQRSHIKSFNPTGIPIKVWGLVKKPAFQIEREWINGWSKPEISPKP